MPGTALPSTDAMFDLRMSEKSMPLFEQVKQFIADEVEPITDDFYRHGHNRSERWSWAPGQLELLDGARRRRRNPGSGTSSCPTPRRARG
ncbi:MAG: hypothetical protein WKF58_03290 [Ilumatobacteraceae bacterium]